MIKLLDTNSRIGPQWRELLDPAKRQAAAKARLEKTVSRIGAREATPREKFEKAAHAAAQYVHGQSTSEAQKEALSATLLATAADHLKSQNVDFKLEANRLVLLPSQRSELNRYIAGLNQHAPCEVAYEPSVRLGSGFGATFHPPGSLSISHEDILHAPRTSPVIAHEAAHFTHYLEERKNPSSVSAGVVWPVGESKALPPALCSAYESAMSVSEMQAYVCGTLQWTKELLRAQTPSLRRKYLDHLKVEVGAGLHCGLTIMGVQARALKRLETAQIAPQYLASDGRLMSAMVANAGPGREHAYGYPADLAHLTTGAHAQEVARRARYSRTHVAAMRGVQTVVDQIDAHMLESKAELKALLQSYVPLLERVYADRADGKIELSFEQVIAELNSRLQ